MFLIAIAAGIISNVPGGVGVFESVLLLLFRSVPADQLLGSLLAYRIIYYLTPFAVALALLGAHELWAHRAPMVRVAQLATHLARARSPRRRAPSPCSAPARCCCFPGRPRAPAVAWRCCAISCRCPSSSCRICWAVRSASALLVLANGLYRRLDAAWYLTMWLLCAGVLLSLLKGFDFEEAIMLGAVAVMLVSARAPISPAGLLDRAAFLRFLGRGGAAGARRRDLAGVLRLSARALQQGVVVAVCVRGAGAPEPARLAARRHDCRQPTRCGACCAPRSR